MKKVIIAGVGNTLAGDDGVGIYMVRELRQRLSDYERLFFIELEGDLYQIWDLLPEAEAFIFLDAVAGERPGEVKTGKTLPRAYTPSFHQSDLSAVLKSLEIIYDGDFPNWTLWGVTIDPPGELGEGLSEPVLKAADAAVKEIMERLEAGGFQIEGTAITL